MNVVSLFSGIGGFDEGFRRAGLDVIAACEINADCRKILASHFPEAKVYEDVKTITSKTFAGRAIDVLVGGFPCQDLSVAGRRAGLAGERSGLWFEFLRIITDHKPRWVVIENVPGLLSSNGGADFTIILRGLVELGYGVCWRILDAQHFGLAQRRKRLFIVASRGDGRAAEILFEREGGGWNPAPSREAGERSAATLTAGVAGSRGINVPGRRREDDINLVGFGDGIDLARCVTTGEGARQDYETCTMITHTLRAEGFDADEDGTGRGTPLIAYPIQEAGKRTGVSTDDVRCELDIGAANDPMYTLQSGAQHGVCAFQQNASGEVRAAKVGYTLNTNSNSSGRNTAQIAGSFGVRRLMPVECEALQGFPRNWTATGVDGKPISDSARYRMLGNAVAVPCAEWIARRIMAIEHK
jgi:DNA (cytosine-5)-methyltransferase 1